MMKSTSSFIIRRSHLVSAPDYMAGRRAASTRVGAPALLIPGVAAASICIFKAKSV